MLRVAVGSKNPVKLNAVRAGFMTYWPELNIEVLGVSADSGVAAQPLSDAESLMGARNRAQAALDATPDAAYGVGIEGGLQKVENVWMDTQWAVVINRAGKSSIGQSVRAEVPEVMVKKILAGMELGDVIDEIFGQKNMKQAGGFIQEITQGNINREKMCLDGVLVALAPFTSPDLYNK